MKHRDALRIASTKFRTRKIRTVFLLLSLAVGLTMIAGLAGGAAGIMKTARVIFADSAQGRYYAVESIQANGEESLGGNQKSAELDVVAHAKELEAKYNKQPIQIQYIKMNRDSNSNQTLTSLPELTAASQSFSVQTSTVEFIAPYILEPNVNWDTPQDGPVPILVPTAVLITGGPQDFYNKSAKEQYEFFQQQQKQYVGKVVQYRSVQLSSGSNAIAKEFTSKTQFKIVGFVPEDSYASNLYQYGSFVIPDWAPQRIPEVKQLFEGGSYRAMIPFANKKERNTFIDEKTKEEADAAIAAAATGTIPIGNAGFSRYFGAAQGRFDAFAEIAGQIQKFFFGVAGFLLAIGEIMLLLTVGRVAADSRKEIGVYRAIGASRADIRKIFFWYVCVLAVCATVIATILAVIGQIIVSVKWGEDLFYGLVKFSGTAAGVSQPDYLFLGTNALHIIALFVFALLSALIASAIPILRASRIDPIIALKEE